MKRKKYGLINSQIGIVKDIVYKPGITPPNFPEAVIVYFENYTGPQYFQSIEKRNQIPIQVYSKYNAFYNSTRTQIPLKLAYSITITKSQGSTLHQIIVNLGDSERTLGLAYTALTRVKNYKDILILPFNYERLQNIKKSTAFQNRKLEMERLENYFVKTKTDYAHLI